MASFHDEVRRNAPRVIMMRLGFLKIGVDLYIIKGVKGPGLAEVHRCQGLFFSDFIESMSSCQDRGVGGIVISFAYLLLASSTHIKSNPSWP